MGWRWPVSFKGGPSERAVGPPFILAGDSGPPLTSPTSRFPALLTSFPAVLTGWAGNIIAFFCRGDLGSERSRHVFRSAQPVKCGGGILTQASGVSSGQPSASLLPN